MRVVPRPRPSCHGDPHRISWTRAPRAAWAGARAPAQMTPPAMAWRIALGFPFLILALSALHASPSLAARGAIARHKSEARAFAVSEFALDPPR
eukprot:8251229-Pyramimonas_sp.AAC.1